MARICEACEIETSFWSRCEQCDKCYCLDCKSDVHPNFCDRAACKAAAETAAEEDREAEDDPQ